MQDTRCRNLASCLLLLASCFLFLTSCSSPLARFPGTVRPTVKIGLVAPFEGRYRYIGYEVIYGVRLALREANHAGGVGGYNVELVAYDDGADPTVASEQARKLAVDPEVVTAIGHFREETTAAALSAYAEAGIPLVAPAVLDPALTQGEAQFYRLGPAADTLARVLLDHVGRDDVVALVSDGGPLGAALVEAASQQGIKVSTAVSPDAGDWLGEMLASGADAAFCDAAPVTAGEVVAALREAGWEGDFLGGPDLAASDFAAVAGQATEGTLFVTPYPFPADVSGSGDFIAAYQNVSNGTPPGSLALPAYEATWVLLEALERDIAAHGKPTREGVAAALPATERKGLLGRVTFDNEHNWGDVPLYWYRTSAAEGRAVLLTAQE